MSFLTDQIKKQSWKSIWAGDWTMLPCSDWGEFFTTDLKIFGKRFLSKVAFVFRDGKVSCWVPEKEIDDFGKRMALKVEKNPSEVSKIAQELVKRADTALEFMRNNKEKVTPSMYSQYVDTIRKQYVPHLMTKYVVDGLSSTSLTKFLPILQEARVHAEPVFSETIKFDLEIARQINKKNGLDTKLALFLTRDEVKELFAAGKLPSVTQLQQRRTESVLFFDRGKGKIFLGSEARMIEKALLPSNNTTLLKGSGAYPGTVKGIVKVVLDPSKTNHFREGDILVSSMTRPEYLPLMKKCAAVVTDAGGILSHAAITARELKKPCVIGTKIATKVLKDGDLIEVDADKGRVKKIS